MPGELQEVKEEIAQLSTRMGNVEGYFNNFDVTLTNHMTEYKTEQKEIHGKVRSLNTQFKWGFWIIFSLLLLVLGGFTAGFVTLLVFYLELTGG